jgi:ankyrin repeat protein
MVAIAAIGAALSCAGQPPRGGAAETELASATQAGDVAKVKQLLASGADPNKMVDVAGNPQSAWYLALYSLRESKPATTEIVLTMLGAGANPRVAWGTNGGRPRRTFWKQFMSGSRIGGTYDESPIAVAMGNPMPAVITALVKTGSDLRGGGEALVWAVENNDVDLVHLLVESGVDVNGGSGPVTPFGAAIESRNVVIMTYLEEHGGTERGR